VELRKHPDAMEAEASVILKIQQDLGLNYDGGESNPKARLVDMEVRDQQKMNENEVALHPQ
jgi:hypothetical protein